MSERGGGSRWGFYSPRPLKGNTSLWVLLSFRFLPSLQIFIFLYIYLFSDSHIFQFCSLESYMHSGLSMHMYVSHLLIRKLSTFNLINTTSCLRRNKNKIFQVPSFNTDFMRIHHLESPHGLIRGNLPGKPAVYKINVVLNEGLY